MRLNNGKNRSPEIRQGSDIRNIKTDSAGLGVTSAIGYELGNDEIRFGSEDSQRRNTFSSGQYSDHEIPGKIVGQLIHETEKQLAYHKSQTTELESRLEELHRLAGSNQDTE